MPSFAFATLPAGTAPDAVVRRYFGDKARLVDTTLQHGSPGKAPFAYWFVVAQTTPNAGALPAAIEFMARQYANQGRDVILRVEVVPSRTLQSGRVAPDTVGIVWNPTETTHTSDMMLDPLPPHALDVGSAFVASRMTGGVLASETILSNVTTQTLLDAAAGKGGLTRILREQAALP